MSTRSEYIVRKDTTTDFLRTLAEFSDNVRSIHTDRDDGSKWDGFVVDFYSKDAKDDFNQSVRYGHGVESIYDLNPRRRRNRRNRR